MANPQLYFIILFLGFVFFSAARASQLRIKFKEKGLKNNRDNLKKESHHKRRESFTSSQGMITYKLRNSPLLISVNDYIKMFKLNENGMPVEYIDNAFIDNGDGTVTDLATALIWQKSGSSYAIKQNKINNYIDYINEKKFAGYTGWRLPTIEELMSLIEQERQSNNYYINPIFDNLQDYCLSSDQVIRGKAWHINFNLLKISYYMFGNVFYVRAVRDLNLS